MTGHSDRSCFMILALSGLSKVCINYLRSTGERRRAAFPSRRRLFSKSARAETAKLRRRASLVWNCSRLALLTQANPKSSFAGARPRKACPQMIVCSCNILTDVAIRKCIVNSPVDLASASEVYEQLGCAPRCGRCVRTILAILRETTQEGAPQTSARIEEEAIA
jgi:bacterioferritin-associated ferredoxin